MRGIMLVAYATTACSIPAQNFDSLACATDLAATTAPAMLSITGNVFDPNSGLAVPGATITGFDASDNKLFTVVSSALGGFGADFQTGGKPVNGYLTITGPDSDDVPAIFYPGKPISTPINISAQILSTSELSMIGSAVGSAVPSDTVMFIAVLDCQGAPIKGAEVAVVGGTTLYLDPNEHPDPTATGTDPNNGAAIVLGAMGSSVGITASVSRTGDGDNIFQFHTHAVAVMPGMLVETESVP